MKDLSRCCQKDIRVEYSQNFRVKIRRLGSPGGLGVSAVQQHDVASRRIEVNHVLVSPNIVCGVVEPHCFVAIDSVPLKANIRPRSLSGIVGGQAHFLQQPR